MALKAENGFRVPNVLALFSYKLNFEVARVLMGAWIGVCIIACLVGFGAILIDFGNHLFGSGTTSAFTAVNSTLKDIAASHRGHLLASLVAALAVLTTIERGALAQLATAVGAIALHLVLLGSML